MRVLYYHYKGEHTIIGFGYIINGCQKFTLENADEVFAQYNIQQDIRDEVIRIYKNETLKEQDPLYLTKLDLSEYSTKVLVKLFVLNIETLQHKLIEEISNKFNRDSSTFEEYNTQMIVMIANSQFESVKNKLAYFIASLNQKIGYVEQSFLFKQPQYQKHCVLNGSTKIKLDMLRMVTPSKEILSLMVNEDNIDLFDSIINQTQDFEILKKIVLLGDDSHRLEIAQKENKLVGFVIKETKSINTLVKLNNLFGETQLITEKVKSLGYLNYLKFLVKTFAR